MNFLYGVAAGIYLLALFWLGIAKDPKATALLFIASGVFAIAGALS